jgi:sulfotransferase family protein
VTLPNFIVIGAAKAGTTALYWYLSEHPDVYMSPMKETNYFAYGLDDQGKPLYGIPELHRFPVQSRTSYEALFGTVGRASAIGEASPIYLECPQAATRMADLVPEARIVCGLREPVDRAYSDYVMYLRKRGRRLDPERDLTVTSEWARPDSHWMRISRYYAALARYFDVFPQERIHVFLFDDFKRDARGVVQQLYAFLEVDATFVCDMSTPHNVGGQPSSMLLERILMSKSVREAVEPRIPKAVADWARRIRTMNLAPAPPLPAELKHDLSRTFRDDILRTSDLIDRTLDHWLP